ncbi:acyltransferase [Bradyrhizobium sp. WSM1417]|uniref:acyltransferase family protein n=1 Tax=Bradyrhizobium sp. WSM1417 TaxID=754500 RepID=UPI000485FDE8|nr:acyltransferase [Bradyrhizobium sp. WSM1417]
MQKVVPLGRFAFVDALRGLAALAVVLFHALEGGHIPTLEEAMPVWLKFVLSHGNEGVAVFFVLSGFVIAHSLYAVRVTIPISIRFMARRSIRLDPPYWAAIVVAIAFGMASSIIVPGKMLFDVSAAQLLAHLFYLQDILGYHSLNTVFWTLCLEVQFYLLYVAMLLIARNNPDLPHQGRVAPTILTVAMIVSLLWPTRVVTSPFGNGSFLPFWHGFLIGALAYWSWRNRNLVPLLFATIAILVAFTNWNPFSICCAIAALSLWAAACSGSIKTALDWKWLQFLGTISYSLYLIHNPITGASFRVGYMITGHAFWWELIWWSLSLVACIVVAYAMWWLVERPSIGMARRLKLLPGTSNSAG